MKEAGSHGPSPDCCHPTAVGLVFWLFGLGAAEVLDQSSVALYCLSICILILSE